MGDARDSTRNIESEHTRCSKCHRRLREGGHVWHNHSRGCARTYLKPDAPDLAASEPGAIDGR